MSGVVSGIGKVFQAAVGGVARITQAVSAVGKTVFTAGAATGAGSMASGGLNGIISSFAGNGVLGNILTGAIKTAIPGALVGAAVGGLTGTGVLKGALMGGAGGAVMGGFGAMAGVVPGNTPTGVEPTGTTTGAPSALPQPSFDARWGGNPAPPVVTPTAPAPAIAPGATPAPAGGNGFMSMFQGQTGAALLSGLGQGGAAYLQQKSLEEEAQRDRDAIMQRQQRITDSYNVDPAVLAGGSSAQQQPADSTVVQPQAPPSPRRYGPTKRYEYDGKGRVVTNPV